MNSAKFQADRFQSSRFQSRDEIRLKFTRAMSDMYQLEVPLYKKLLSLASNINQKTIDHSRPLTPNESRLLQLEHHGAIRVGNASELFMIRRLFNVMGMYPVDYYDLSVAGIPVHSTAFRALNKDELALSPFRVFCSLLRLDLITDNKLREQVNEVLNRRQVFPKELLKLIEVAEERGGLRADEVASLVENALEVFRWHQEAVVSKQIYDKLKTTHGLVADIVSFKGPHINHLTPKVLNIDACQVQFSLNGIKAKAVVEGPPRRNCPILLRQTSFLASTEKIIFSDGEEGTHTARFGEVEQRGIALTPKGRELYDKLLLKARSGKTEIDYEIRLGEAFKEFPDTYAEIRHQELGYFHYSVNAENANDSVENNVNNNISTQADDLESLITSGVIHALPMIYEDFLPVSAAGIFSSNLSSKPKQMKALETVPLEQKNIHRERFEEALGTEIKSSFALYEVAQQASLKKVFNTLGIDF